MLTGVASDWLIRTPVREDWGCSQSDLSQSLEIRKFKSKLRVTLGRSATSNQEMVCSVMGHGGSYTIN